MTTNLTFEQAFEQSRETYDILGSMVKDETLMRVVKHLMESAYHIGARHELEKMNEKMEAE